MITSFGYFKSFRELADASCQEIQFANNGPLEIYIDFITCDGVSTLIDVQPGGVSASYCVHPDNDFSTLEQDPNVDVIIIRDCLDDSDVVGGGGDPGGPTAPSPSPSPSPSPGPSPLPGDKFQ